MLSRSLPPVHTRGCSSSPSTSYLHTHCRPTPRMLRSRTSAVGLGTDAKISSGLGRSYILPNGLVDYYEVLNVDDDADIAEIKKAYRSLAKECHPDVHSAGHDICILLNEAYTILSDPAAREKYNAKLEQALADAEDDYTGKALSKWIPTLRPKMAKNADPNERRAVFVDESACIGCKMCVWCASATFRMEREHGRSRVFAQWLDPEEKIQASIDSCPVNCIHWVDKDELPALEYVMQVRMTERTNVGIMMGGYGGGPTQDVWSQTAGFMKERKRREEARQSAAERNRAYTPAQEQARRKAAQALSEEFSWFQQKFGNIFETTLHGMNMTVNASASSEDLLKVGKRKRVAKWDVLEKLQQQGNGYSVPLERALVPISVYAETQDTKAL